MTVTFRTAAQDRITGVRTFYMSSLTGHDAEYVLKVIRTPRRRTMTCTCGDFVHRGAPLTRYCKHLQVLREVIVRMHGVSRIPRGVSKTIRVARHEG